MADWESSPSEIQGPSPCDECRWRVQCARERLACAAFSSFVATGREDLWRNAARFPSRTMYERLGL